MPWGCDQIIRVIQRSEHIFTHGWSSLLQGWIFLVLFVFLRPERPWNLTFCDLLESRGVMAPGNVNDPYHEFFEEHFGSLSLIKTRRGSIIFWAKVGDVDWLKDVRQCRMRHQQSNHVNGNFFHSNHSPQRLTLLICFAWTRPGLLELWLTTHTHTYIMCPSATCGRSWRILYGSEHGLYMFHHVSSQQCTFAIRIESVWECILRIGLVGGNVDKNPSNPKFKIVCRAYNHFKLKPCCRPKSSMHVLCQNLDFQSSWAQPPRDHSHDNVCPFWVDHSAGFGSVSCFSARGSVADVERM